MQKKAILQCFGAFLSKSILKTDVNPVLYFVILSFSLIQTILCVLDQKSVLFSLLKWLDPSFFVDNFMLAYLLFVLCFICSSLIILEIYWSATSKQIELNILHHYRIKICSILSICVSYTLFLTQIRCAMKLSSLDSIFPKVLGIVSLVLFFGIVFPYSMFLLIDLSPENKRVYSYVSFPNCFTFINIYRIVASILIATGNSTYSLIVAGFLLLALLVGSIKTPIITWRFNTISQLYVSFLIWTILNRFIYLILQQDITISLFIIGTPIFGIFFISILRKRMIYIVQQPKNSIEKVKILYYLILNLESYNHQLSNFLLSHYRQCDSSQCKCQKIFNQLYEQKKLAQKYCQQNQNVNNTKKTNDKQSFGNQMKKNQTKQRSLKQILKLGKLERPEQNEEKKSKQHQCWFELLLSLQKNIFNIEKVRQMPASDREQLMSKAHSILFDQAEIMHYRLDRQYQSLKYMWFAEEIDNHSPSLFLLVRFTIEKFKQEETIRKKSNEDGSNLYALNYYEMQTKLIRFKQLLLKVAQKTEKFWVEFLNGKPDQKKTVKALQQVLKSRRQLNKERNNYLQDFSATEQKNLSQYQKEWNNKVKSTLENAFECFQNAIRNSNFSIPELNDLDGSNNHRGQTLEKNLQFYDHKAITGMGVVNIQDGENFGLITATNKQFWRLLNYEKFDKARINHFLVKQMHDYHTKTMVNFLKQNKHFLNFHRGFVIDSSHLIVQIQFSVQLLPQLTQGLFAAVFLQESTKTKALILVNCLSNILCYNSQFKREFLKDMKVQQYDEFITKQTVADLIQHRQIQITINQQELTLKMCHSISGQTQAQMLNYCEIHRQWDKTPKKTALMQEEEMKQNFFGTKLKRELTLESQKKVEIVVKKESKQIFKQKQKKSEQMQQINHLFSILSEERVSMKLVRGKIFIIVMFCFIVILALICSGFSQIKKTNYETAFYEFGNFSRAIQILLQRTMLMLNLTILLHSKGPNKDRSILVS